MYKSHQNLIEPPEDAKLWRYLDIAKFIHLLDSESLFFTRITNFDDPYEGHMTKGTLNDLLEIPKSFPEEERKVREKVIRHNVEFFLSSRPLLCASCWHENKAESAAMWSLYVGTGKGIAIQTTFAKFKDSFSTSKQDVSAGMVQYIDYETYNLDPTNMFNFGIVKRHSFEHEREIRALLLEPSNNPGVYVDIDLSALIQKIVVSPSSPKWFYDVVFKQAEKKGLGDRVVQSLLLDNPDYLAGFINSEYGV